MLEVKDVKLKRRSGDYEDGRVIKRGRTARREIKLKSYDVLGPDGAFIGVVAMEMQTFEREPWRGATWVTKRWESPRWKTYTDRERLSGWSRTYYDTRKDAVEALLRGLARRMEQD